MPITITLIIPGNLKYSVDWDCIRNWKTKIFDVVNTERIDALPNALGAPSGYTDQQLAGIFRPSSQSDITFAIIGAQLDLNFYARILPSGVVVLSLFEMGDILDREHFDIEVFVLRCIYALILVFIENSGRLSLSAAVALFHDETRGCLYDFTQNKVEIVHSLDKPGLCADCRARLGHAQIDAEFIPTLFRELKRVRKSRYYRIIDWAKKNPVKTLMLTTLWAILLNVSASFIYDLFKSGLH